MFFPEFLLVLNNFNFDVCPHFLFQSVFQIFRIAVLYFLFTISFYYFQLKAQPKKLKKDAMKGMA